MNKVTAIVVFVVVISLVVWFFSKKDETVDLINIIPVQQEGEGVESNEEARKVFQDDEIGISFSYPAYFNDIKIEFFESEKGKSFTGVVESVQGNHILFGGVSKDFISSRGGGIMDNYGYKKIADKYFINFVWGDAEVSPSAFWELNGEGQAMVIQNTEIDQLLASDMVAVLVNIPNTSFSAITFQIIPPPGDSRETQKDVETLNEIVSSIYFY